MPLKFQHVASEQLREIVAAAATFTQPVPLAEVEYCLLRKHDVKLRFGNKEKATLMDMAIDTYSVANSQMEVEVRIRSLCHSRVVTADYVQHGERFNLRRCILVLGALGEAPNPWASLAQPALRLFTRDFNVIWVEVPAFSTNATKYLRYGPAILLAMLKELQVDRVSVLACGVGGALFLAALAQSPGKFAATHFVYNMDLPKGTGKVVPFSVQDVEDIMRERELQVWCAYNDEVGVFDRSDWGTAVKAYEVMTKLQARLEGERRRGLRFREYDEVLVTEALNNPRLSHVQRLPAGRDVILAFSEAFLDSLVHFFESRPLTYQDDMTDGLVPDRVREVAEGIAHGGLLALAPSPVLRPGPSKTERLSLANHNRRRLERTAAATVALMPLEKRPAVPPTGASVSELRELGYSASAPALVDDEAYDEDDFSLTRGDPTHRAYLNMWRQQRFGDSG